MEVHLDALVVNKASNAGFCCAQGPQLAWVNSSNITNRCDWLKPRTAVARNKEQSIIFFILFEFKNIYE
jgi:hypothetical protein